jgi:hypothetical protein
METEKLNYCQLDDSGKLIFLSQKDGFGIFEEETLIMVR